MKRTTNIALAATVAMAMLLGVTACSDGDDYSDVGPAPETKDGDTTKPSGGDGSGGGTNSALPAGMLFSDAAGTTGTVVNDSGAVPANTKANEKDAKATIWTLGTGMSVWAVAGQNVVLTFPMPEDWDDTTTPVFGKYDSGGPGYTGNVSLLDGTAPDVNTTVAVANKKVTLTINTADIGKRMVVNCRYATKAGGINEVTWTVPVAKKPTLNFSVAAGILKADYNGAVAAGGSATTLFDYPLDGSTATLSSIGTSAGSGQLAIVASENVGNDTNKISDVAANGKKRVLSLSGTTITIDAPGTATINFNYDNHKVPVTVTVKASGTVEAKLTTKEADKGVVIPQPTLKSDAGFSSGKAVAQNAAIAKTEATKPLWVGTSTTGAAADTVLTFKDFEDTDGYIGAYSVAEGEDADGNSIGKVAGNTAFGGSAGNELTLDGTSAAASLAKGYLVVKYKGYTLASDNKTLLTLDRTYDLHVVQWPTLAVAINSTKNTLDATINGDTAGAAAVVGVPGLTTHTTWKEPADVNDPSSGDESALLTMVEKEESAAIDFTDPVSTSAVPPKFKILGSDTKGGVYTLILGANAGAATKTDVTVTVSDAGVPSIMAGKLAIIANPKITTANTGYGTIDDNGKAAANTEYDPTQNKAIFTGVVGTGPSDITVTFATPKDSDGHEVTGGTWTVDGADNSTGFGTGTTANVLTIDKDQTAGTLSIKYDKAKTATTPEYHSATYEIEVAAWPTLEITAFALTSGNISGVTAAPVSASSGTGFTGCSGWDANVTTLTIDSGAQSAASGTDTTIKVGNAAIAGTNVGAEASTTKLVFTIKGATTADGEDVTFTAAGNGTDADHTGTVVVNVKVAANGTVTIPTIKTTGISNAAA